MTVSSSVTGVTVTDSAADSTPVAEVTTREKTSGSLPAGIATEKDGAELSNCTAGPPVCVQA